MQREIVEREIESMLQNDIIEPSDSPYASPVCLVKKKDGSVRFCIDYRRLNSQTKKDAFPLPRIDESLESLTGARWFSTLDIASGYWQCKMAEKDKNKTKQLPQLIKVFISSKFYLSVYATPQQLSRD